MKKPAFLMIIFLLVLNTVTFSQESKNASERGIKKEKRIEKRGDRRELKILKGTKVSDASMKSFKTDFTKATNVKWVRTPEYDIATFNLKKKELKAYYDSDGQLVGTTEIKTIDDLPDRGVKALQKKYKDYTIGTITYFNNNEVNRSPMLMWGTEIEDQSNFFVELTKGTKKMVVYMDQGGNIKPFKQL